MLNRIVLAISAGLAFTGAEVAHAEAPYHRTNDEAGWVMHGPEYRKVGGVWKRVDVWNDFDEPGPVFQGTYTRGEASADGLYEFVGGNAGLAPTPVLESVIKTMDRSNAGCNNAAWRARSEPWHRWTADTSLPDR